ncbi:unnamed protein product [Rotaria sordida]|uniref:Uncharacterized protein n=2 Tax=Rotaria sordida TaxID=392033 RepID=A0A818TLA6_9BILA|nr:unnamed protein product [Rotaria sordida]
MSIFFRLIIMIVLVVMMSNGYSLLGALTEDECKAYFVSNDFKQRLHARFVCPKKWRPRMNKIESVVAKRSVIDLEDNRIIS